MSFPTSPTSPLAEEKLVVYLGPNASFTHEATLKTFHPDIQPWWRLRAVGTIEDIVATVASGEASRGVVPFENSSNGSVVATLDLLANLNGKYGNIVVVDEAYVSVRHCIVGIPAPKSDTDTNALPLGDAEPKHDLSHIKKLYTHPQAWGQCKRFLSTHLKGVERQDVSSTSRGAAIVAETQDATTASISSPLAAKENNLTILAEAIQDDANNTTRFLIIRQATPEHASVDACTFVNDDVEWARYKTLVSFTVSHEQPGALADCLAVFKKHHLNLTSINSRPSGEAPFHYIFFVEFRGRRRAPQFGGPVNEALEELQTVARTTRWLGSWDGEEANSRAVRVAEKQAN